jgi:hypothetical protein
MNPNSLEYRIGNHFATAAAACNLRPFSYWPSRIPEYPFTPLPIYNLIPLGGHSQ